MLYWFQAYSKVNQSYVYTYALFLRFFSNIALYRVLSSVPCAILYVLISYFIYSSVYMSVISSPLILSSLPASPTTTPAW